MVIRNWSDFPCTINGHKKLEGFPLYGQYKLKSVCKSHKKANTVNTCCTSDSCSFPVEDVSSFNRYIFTVSCLQNIDKKYYVLHLHVRYIDVKICDLIRGLFGK